MEKIYNIANMYVATLRALYLIHQNCHWLVKGTGFYGDHLLFERLYKSAQENADAAAERFIGLFGEMSVDFSYQSDCIAKLLDKYQGEDYYELSLTIEKDFLAFSEQVYDIFEREEVMTLGLDDLIMNIASERETACYLLQQAVDKKY